MNHDPEMLKAAVEALAFATVEQRGVKPCVSIEKLIEIMPLSMRRLLVDAAIAVLDAVVPMIAGRTVVGNCDDCGRPVFADEEYLKTNEGPLYFCPHCAVEFDK